MTIGGSEIKKERGKGKTQNREGVRDPPIGRGANENVILF